MIGDAGSEPGNLLHQLEAGVGVVEFGPDHQRNHKGDEGRGERDPTGDMRPALFRTARKQNGDDADERQEGRYRKNGKPAHDPAPTKMNQVASATTPISMAKA